MVEYVVVLVFGVMVLTIGPGGDVLLDLLAVMNDNHQGYSYAASLSTLPDHDNIGDYLLEGSGLDPSSIETQLSSLLGGVTGTLGLPDISDMPLGPGAILDGALSFW